jgi:Na+(H+)/acetate symporter ActP
MATNHDATTADDDDDFAAHEATYVAFLSLTEVVIAHLICVVLCLVLWGLEGHGFVAFVGIILASAASLLGGMTGLTWRAVAPIAVLLGLAAIVLK